MKKNTEKKEPAPFNFSQPGMTYGTAMRAKDIQNIYSQKLKIGQKPPSQVGGPRKAVLANQSTQQMMSTQ